jgi:hypothetical protein
MHKFKESSKKDIQGTSKAILQTTNIPLDKILPQAIINKDTQDKHLNVGYQWGKEVASYYIADTIEENHTISDTLQTS